MLDHQNVPNRNHVFYVETDYFRVFNLQMVFRAKRKGLINRFAGPNSEKVIIIINIINIIINIIIINNNNYKHYYQ